MTVRTQDVQFPSDGVNCAATLYLPPNDGPPAPGLVMGNGFANVRQMYLPEYAEAFAAAGLAVLVIDYRFLGESGGEPRQQVLPESQCDDLRNALTWLSEQSRVDPGRLGLWGTSFSGGHVMRIAAYDRRVKAVVAQVPAIGLWRYLRRSEPAVREAFLAKALARRVDFARTGTPSMIAITGPEATESVLGADGYDWHRSNEQRHPTFHNAITAASLDRIVAYDPGGSVEPGRRSASATRRSARCDTRGPGTSDRGSCSAGRSPCGTTIRPTSMTDLLTRAAGRKIESMPQNGYHTVTPRLVVSDLHGAVQFLCTVFDGSGDVEEGRPAEIRIGDSLVMVTSVGERDLFPAFLYVYVADADETYRRALEAGAETLEAPQDTPYGDRRAMVRDPYGNVFQVAHRMPGAAS